MAVLEIRTFPDPVLRKIAGPIENITDEIVRLSENMVETMIFAHGAGLAASQIGVATRLITIDASLVGKKKPLVILNPVIVETIEEEVGEEGCLSVPGFSEFVKRAKKVSARGTDMAGKTLELECEGQFARAMQHEIDHLNGILFIDHLSPIKKNIFKKKYAGQKK
ncbi:MAG TPA: peptide deformylase [Syntrophorhabdaceae bacterium]|nr:peptide deformylase [Syntrophorhabdaceae bacterium]